MMLFTQNENLGVLWETQEMYRTFNMGVGMILVVNPSNVDSILASTDGYVIGELKSGERKVEFI